MTVYDIFINPPCMVEITLENEYEYTAKSVYSGSSEHIPTEYYDYEVTRIYINNGSVTICCKDPEEEEEEEDDDA